MTLTSTLVQLAAPLLASAALACLAGAWAPALRRFAHLDSHKGERRALRSSDRCPNTLASYIAASSPADILLRARILSSSWPDGATMLIRLYSVARTLPILRLRDVAVDPAVPLCPLRDTRVCRQAHGRLAHW